MSSNPFVLAPDEYKRDINIVKHAVDQYASFLSISTGKDIEQCREYVLTSFKKGGQFEFKDPTINYLERQDNGDRKEMVSTTWKYISDSISNREIIAPTLTTYVHPDTDRSLLSDFLELNVALRNKAKHAMFTAEANKDELTRQMKSTEQKNNKLSNNSVSGMHCSPANPIYNETGHSSLTSTCRSTSAYGNSNNEKFISGNRHYYNHHIVLNNIVSVVSNCDEAAMLEVMAKYSLNYPTVEQTLECIKYSTNLYWWEKHYFSKIEDLVNKLTPIQRAAFVYIGDFYHLRKHNDGFAREFLNKLTEKVTGTVDVDPISIIKKADEVYVMFAHQICCEEVKGFGKKYNEMKVEDTHTLALTILNIDAVFKQYSDFIKVFWVTKNLPASVSHLPTSLRRSALTSDTDSTIFTVQDWIHWHRGYYTLDNRAIALIGAMTTLASLTIIHVLAIMSANFGVVQKHIYRIKMKNEFRFDVFIPTQLGKHYFANIGCTEGNVYERHKMEIKGVYLKSSTLPRYINNKAEGMMRRITDQMMTISDTNPHPISVREYLTEVADIEREIIASIKKGDTVFLKSQNINAAESYKKDEDESPYKHHTFWNEVFGPKYGCVAEPPYETVKVSSILDGRKDLDDWITSIQDPDVKSRMLNWVNKTGQVRYVGFNLPMQIIRSTGIPTEIASIINYKKIVIDLCSIFYIILETLGVYMYDDHVARLISDYY